MYNYVNVKFNECLRMLLLEMSYNSVSNLKTGNTVRSCGSSLKINPSLSKFK